MTKETFISFSDYCTQHTVRPQAVTHKTKDEILEDSETILRALRQEHLKGR